MILYLVTNAVNGKRYVGITTKPLAYRWRQHVSYVSSKDRSALHYAILKYGEGAFTIEEIGTADCFDGLKEMEVAAIRDYRTRAPHGYNLTDGGDGCAGFKMPAKHVERMREYNRNISDEERERRRVAATGNQWSVGCKRTDEQRKAIGDRRRGAKASDETRKKIRAARAKQEPTFGMKGKVHSAETRAKMSAAKIGKTKSPETIERMRAAARRRVEARRAGDPNP